MQYRYIVIAAFLVLGACSFTSNQNTVQGDFHPPLVYKPWEFEAYTLQNGVKACGLSSGDNGITVFITQHHEVAIRSNRHMQPGTALTVSANGGTYEADGEFFAKSTVPHIIDHFVQGGTGYVEWREYSGPHQAAVRVQNMMHLDNFKSQWEQCKKSVGVE